MIYFDQNYPDFFKELAKNNNKEWFHSQKKRYEDNVKKPFERFVTDLISEIQKYDPLVDVTAKECMSRINKDIRFSKDKTPYNLHFTAFISRAGKKDKSIPGLYIRFSGDKIAIMAGCFGLSKDQLFKVRTSIKTGLNEFKAIYSDEKLIYHFGAIQGEVHKRIPEEFKEAFLEEGHLSKKQYYIVAELEFCLLQSTKLIDELMDYWFIANPFNTFLMESIKG